MEQLEQLTRDLQRAAQGEKNALSDKYRALEQRHDLRATSWNNPRNNPHVWLQLAAGDGYCSSSMALSQYLRPETPRLMYQPRVTISTALVDSQRMLLMAEIEFLTRYGHLATTVVYAGAASGAHISALAELFPHTFHLYDSMPFSPLLVRESSPLTSTVPNVVLHQELFTDALAEQWSSQSTPSQSTTLAVLFIGDIVSSDYEAHGIARSELLFAQDMRDQRRWCEIMRPAMACLRFRLPWPAASIKRVVEVADLVDQPATEYFVGDLFLPPWTSSRSSIARLFTDCTRLTRYDHLAYEEQMSFHNRASRLSLHAHNVSGIEGLDHCWDCASELAILRRYMAARDLEAKGLTLDDLLGMVVNKQTRLLTGVVDPYTSRQRFRESPWWKLIKDK